MDFSDAVDQHFPYDGPHSRERVIDAAHGMSALVRYMNNATGPGNGRKTLDWGATVYRLLGGVGGALGGLDQLIAQLADAADRLAKDPTLYDDRRDQPARDTALELAALLERARPALAQLNTVLDRAREVGVHLGND